MRITKKKYVEAKNRVEKLERNLKTAKATIKNWEQAEKEYGQPREGDEIVAFEGESGDWKPTMRRIG